MATNTWKTPIAAAALLASACGSGAPGTSPPTASPAVTIADVAAQERKVHTLARTGVRPELGADGDAMFAEVDQAWAGGLPTLPWALRAPAAPPAAARLLAASGPEIGDTAVSTLAGLFAALEPGLDPSVLNNRTGSKHSDLPFGSADHSWILQLSQSGSNLAVGITARTTYTGKNGKTIDELATGSAETQLCPDAQGKVPFSYTFSISVTTPGGGSQIALSGTGTATVDDDGQLAGWSSESTLGFAAQGGAIPVTGADARVHLSRTFDGNGMLQTGSRTVERDTTVAGVGAAIGDIQNSMPSQMESYILHKAQERWQNGTCVEIVVEGASDANTVAPSSHSAFTGKVRHKFEGVELNAPISAGLAGGKALAPTAPTPAPVAYAYDAPPEEDKLATASLETRSRRGRAKKAVTFFTRALAAYGGTIGLTGSGGDASGTFQYAGSATVRLLRSSVAGGGATYLPDPTSGSVSITTWNTDSTSETCALAGPATAGPEGFLGGNFVMLTTPPSYSFTLAVLAKGTMRCVRKSDGKVTTAAFSPGVNLSTTPGAGDPGFQPVTDPKLLTGTAHFALGGTTQDTSWSLAPQ